MGERCSGVRAPSQEGEADRGELDPGVSHGGELSQTEKEGKLICQGWTWSSLISSFSTSWDLVISTVDESKLVKMDGKDQEIYNRALFRNINYLQLKSELVFLKH